MDNSQYLIFYENSGNKKNFIYEINHDSVYHTEKYLDALYIDTKEHALAILEYCKTRNTYIYKILEIKTTFEVLEDE